MDFLTAGEMIAIDFVEPSAKNDMQVVGMVMNRPAQYPYFPEPGLPGNPSLKRRGVQNPSKPSLNGCGCCGMRERGQMVPGDGVEPPTLRFSVACCPN